MSKLIRLTDECENDMLINVNNILSIIKWDETHSKIYFMNGVARVINQSLTQVIDLSKE